MDMADIQLLRSFVLFHIMIGCCVHVQAKFDFTVQFYEYWNPTGLCGECGMDGIPACCDDITLTGNCSNTGAKRCDTRFRFVLRPYGASVETAPRSNYEHFTRSITNELHETFREGSGGFLSLPNPHMSSNDTAWTGRIQLYIDALDKSQSGGETTAIIDRFPVDLELVLSPSLSQRVSYDGLYNLSQLDMSFRVTCSKNYYGPSCTKLCEPVDRYSCNSDGDQICSNANYDISTNCKMCLPGRNISTNCSECKVGRDPATNCTKCLSGYVGENCVTDIEKLASTGGASNVSDVVLGVFLIIAIAIIIALVVILIVMRKSHKKSLQEDGTDGVQDEKTTNQPPDKPSDNKDVAETKMD